MDKAFQEFEKEFGAGKVRKNEPMSAHTTFKLGGNAQIYLEANTTDEIVKAVTLANKFKIPFFILGGGSNIIVSDKGVPGLVIKNNCRKFEIAKIIGRIKNKKMDVDGALVYAESGVLMNQLVRFTIDHSLAGLEYQLGLPGTVGGAICMNSNFPLKGQYVGDSVYSAKLLTKEGEVREVDNSYFRFAYDKSILQKTGEILLSVIFKLTSMDKDTLWKRATEALEHRNNTQPKGASAGCTFRNISIVEALRIPTPNEITSAGFLIDKAGLKGKSVGDAMISDAHANFILNKGNAKAEDVVKLIENIKNEILQKFGVKLNLEVKKIGF